MKLISWNVNGIRSVIAKGFAQFIQTEAPDVVCVQEIKAKPEQVTDLFFAQGYQLFWNSALRAE